MKLQLLVLIVFFFVIKTSFAEQDTIVIHDDIKQLSCDGKETYFFSSDNLPIQDVLAKKFKKKKEVNLFYPTGWIWVKFIIRNNSYKEQFILHTSDGHISGLYLYKPTLKGYEMSLPKQHHPEDGRELFNRLPSFFIDLKNGETKTFYLKVNTANEIVNFSYVIQDKIHFIEFVQADNMIIGLYFGALLIIIVINIFYFYSLRDYIFLIYALYVFGNFLLTATLDGFIWLIVPNPDLAYHINFFCIRFWNDSMLFFVMQLLNLKQYNKRLNKIGYSFLFYHVVVMAVIEYLNLFDVREHFMAQWEGINWAISLLLALVFIIKSRKNNRYLNRYYIALFIILICVFIFFVFAHTDKGKHYLVFEHGIKVGTLLEIITLSFAVSRRFRFTENDLRKKKEEEQQLTTKVNQLEMDVRKAQMNPHFMFNALTSIEYFIFKNNPEKARRYLNKFADLMRLTLDNSRRNYISLKDELTALEFYVALEFLRLKAYPHHFEIKVDHGVDQDDIHVPALLIQPFVENAIWHGLQKKQAAGKLVVAIQFQDSELICTIEDDGGGIQKKIASSKRKSSGILITKERLMLVHTLLKTNYKFNIEDVKDENNLVIGTQVVFSMPYTAE